MTHPGRSGAGAAGADGAAGAAGAERGLATRPKPSWAMILLGYGCIIAGGLVAAVTGPLDLAEGSWLAAYLVLVGGIAQLALGWVPGVLGCSDAGDPGGWMPVVAWNAGSGLVIVALLLALMQLRGRSEPRAAGGAVRLLGWAYLAVLIVLVVSIPVGIALAHLR